MQMTTLTDQFVQIFRKHCGGQQKSRTNLKCSVSNSKSLSIMEQSHVADLNRIAKYLQVSAGKIHMNNEKVVCRSLKNKTLAGYSTIVSAMARESKSNQFSKCDLVTQCLIVQWFDYAVLFVAPAVNSKSSTELVLQELNDYLLQRSYLVGQGLTLADVVVFYSLSNIMQTLSPATKEKYLNASRWYEHLQKIDDIRQNIPIVNLSPIHLHSWATGTHL